MCIADGIYLVKRHTFNSHHLQIVVVTCLMVASRGGTIHYYSNHFLASILLKFMI